MWESVEELGNGVEAVDDVTLESVVLHARALLHRGLNDAVITRITEAVRKKKGRDADLLNEARYVRAVALEASGKRARAKVEFEKLYAMAPDLHDVKERALRGRESGSAASTD